MGTSPHKLTTQGEIMNMNHAEGPVGHELDEWHPSEANLYVKTMARFAQMALQFQIEDTRSPLRRSRLAFSPRMDVVIGSGRKLDLLFLRRRFDQEDLIVSGRRFVDHETTALAKWKARQG